MEVFKKENNDPGWERKRKGDSRVRIQAGPRVEAGGEHMGQNKDVGTWPGAAVLCRLEILPILLTQ